MNGRSFSFELAADVDLKYVDTSAEIGHQHGEKLSEPVDADHFVASRDVFVPIVLVPIVLVPMGAHDSHSSHH
jgi:hypothetical protein